MLSRCITFFIRTLETKVLFRGAEDTLSFCYLFRLTHSETRDVSAICSPIRIKMRFPRKHPSFPVSQSACRHYYNMLLLLETLGAAFAFDKSWIHKSGRIHCRHIGVGISKRVGGGDEAIGRKDLQSRSGDEVANALWHFSVQHRAVDRKFFYSAMIDEINEYIDVQRK